MSVTLPDGTVITDDTSPTTGLKAGGHRTRFYPCLSAIATWAGQVQAWAAQAQAAAGAGGGTIFPSVNVNNAGQSLVLNSAGTAYLADSAAKGFRNKIINGDFQIWQGGTSFTNPTSTATAYGPDQWIFFRSFLTSGITATQQQTQTASKGIRIQRTAGDTSTVVMILSTVHETIDVVKIAGKTLTVSFWAKKGANYSEASGVLGVWLQYGTGTDSNLATGFTSATVFASTNAVLSTTLSKFSFTFTVPSNSTQFAIEFLYGPTGTAGANDWFEITDVQLEEGSVATPFERKPYSSEFGLCQRYYQTYNVFVSQSSTSKTTFPINMRTTPTIGGGGAGFTSTGTTADALHCYQTTGAAQTLTLSARL